MIFFLLVSLVWVNTARFIFFRISGVALPPSALYGIVAISFLALGLARVRSIPRPRAMRGSILLLFALIFLSYSVGKLLTGGLTNKDLATTWGYFIFPVLCIMIGFLFQTPTTGRSLPSQNVSLFIKLTTLVFVVGIAINATDILIYRDEIHALYQGFATTAYAFLGGYQVPRLTGAYFSSVDLALVTLVLVALRRWLRVGSRVVDYLLLLPLVFTFTRNVYVLMAVMLVFCKFIQPTRTYLILGIMTGGLLTVFSAMYFGPMVSYGDIRASDDVSSVITRLSSWFALSQELLASPMRILFGIGYSQNYFGDSIINVYAVDNAYFEAMSLGGAIAVAAYFGLWLLLIKTFRAETHGLGRFMSALVCALPIFGVFNNVFGWAFFSIILSLVFALPYPVRSSR